jgi:hypothetical protein
MKMSGERHASTALTLETKLRAYWVRAWPSKIVSQKATAVNCELVRGPQVEKLR